MSYLSISDKYSDGTYRVDVTAYEALLHSVERGDEWLRFVTVDGTDVMLRTEAVVAIAYLTDSALDAIAEREAHERMS